MLIVVTILTIDFDVFDKPHAAARTIDLDNPWNIRVCLSQLDDEVSDDLSLNGRGKREIDVEFTQLNCPFHHFTK